VKDTNETSEESVLWSSEGHWNFATVLTEHEWCSRVSNEEYVGSRSIYHRTGLEMYETDDLGLIFRETL
jgi:hypothetical protein